MLAFSFDLDDGRRAEIRFTDRSHGDFSGPDGGAREQAVAPGRWTRLRQQHGAAVALVGAPGDADDCAADAAVTAAAGAVLCVRTADCVPVALVGRRGAVAAVHAGWRGVAAGVVEVATAALGRLGAGSVSAVVGPCIHAECYEFDAAALEGLAARLGPEVRGRTAWATPALDLPAAVRLQLRRGGVADIAEAARCTACEATEWFSHRARGEPQRQALAVWIEPR